MSQELPLAGLRVLTLENFGAGPFGSMYLADLGAEVIKVENREQGGDATRGMGPALGEHDSHFFQTFNFNKKSVCLNLKTAAGREAFRRLAATAQVVLNNLRGDQPEKLGLTYGQLAQVNPRLVCAHLSAYGRDNERKGWPGYDYLMQAEAGYLSVTGEPDGPPARFGLSVVDMMTGLMAAFALATGIIGARANGKGMDMDTSLFDTGLHNLGYLATWYLNAGHTQGREPRSSHPSLTPSQLYRTKDGWLFVMCNKEKFWRVLAEALGHAEWCADPRFADFAARLENRAALQALLDAAFAERTTAAWLERLSGKVPVAPVRDVGDALDNAFARERGDVAEYLRDDGPPVRMVVNPLRSPGVALPRHAAPALGADTDALLGSLGYDAARIGALRACGALG